MAEAGRSTVSVLRGGSYDDRVHNYDVEPGEPLSGRAPVWPNQPGGVRSETRKHRADHFEHCAGCPGGPGGGRPRAVHGAAAAAWRQLSTRSPRGAFRKRTPDPGWIALAAAARHYRRIVRVSGRRAAEHR